MKKFVRPLLVYAIIGLILCVLFYTNNLDWAMQIFIDLGRELP